MKNQFPMKNGFARNTDMIDLIDYRLPCNGDTKAASHVTHIECTYTSIYLEEYMLKTKLKPGSLGLYRPIMTKGPRSGRYEGSILRLTLHHTIPAFFSFSHNVFYPSLNNFQIFIHVYFVVYTYFQFGPVQKCVVW